MPDSFQPDSFVPDETSSRPPQPLLRSRTGALYTPPAESGVGDLARGVGEVINPLNWIQGALAAAQDPFGAAGNLAMAPVRFVGDLLNHPAHAIGNATGMVIMGQTPGLLKAGATGAVKGAAAAGDAVSPDVIGIVSPRAGKAVEVAQKLRRQLGGATASAPAAPAASPAAPAATVPETPLAAPSAPAPQGLKAAAVAEKLNLTAQEYTAFQSLLQQGYSMDKVLHAIQGQRAAAALSSRFGLPSDAEVAASVADRNASGRWPQDR